MRRPIATRGRGGIGLRSYRQTRSDPQRRRGRHAGHVRGGIGWVHGHEHAWGRWPFGSGPDGDRDARECPETLAKARLLARWLLSAPSAAIMVAAATTAGWAGPITGAAVAAASASTCISDASKGWPHERLSLSNRTAGSPVRGLPTRRLWCWAVFGAGETRSRPDFGAGLKPDFNPDFNPDLGGQTRGQSLESPAGLPRHRP